MRTFFIETLGCKVNQYESEQIATLLRRRGLVQADSASSADLRVINMCSVTVLAASKSRQTVRRSLRLPVLGPTAATRPPRSGADQPNQPRPRIIITGCWATSDPEQAGGLLAEHGCRDGAVIGHHDDVAAELERLLDRWNQESSSRPPDESATVATPFTAAHTQVAVDAVAKRSPPIQVGDDVSMNEAGEPAARRYGDSKPHPPASVKQNPDCGTRRLPLLSQQRASHQRALLKVQDGCDAHCTYCIIPRLRSSLWSKPVDQAVQEAQCLVDAGHREIVLSGIFLGAYGHPTAIRRRQPNAEHKPLIDLVEALCTRVRGLRRLRFSSLEPGDLTAELIRCLKAHAQVVPHFHLPLQSGSDQLLRRMNRQYTRDDYLRMIDQVHAAFDRPAITTDIIVGFPGETDEQFQHTLEVVQRVKFIHIHAFSFSPRPGTAAARWTGEFVRGPVVNRRIELLNQLAAEYSYHFRRQFIGQTVEVLVEPQDPCIHPLRHGRCERYFELWFRDEHCKTGDAVTLVIEGVTPTHTLGRRPGADQAGASPDPAQAIRLTGS